VVDIRSLFGEQRGGMKRRPHGNHQLESVCDGGQGRGGGPGVERRRFGALDVVEIQLGDQREIESRALTRPRQPPNIGPFGCHPLVLDVP